MKIPAVFFVLLCTISPASGDACKDKCGTYCSSLTCEVISDVPGGCYFNGANCFNCRAGDKDVYSCEDYGANGSCVRNPCYVTGGCKYLEDMCVSAVSSIGCGTRGCTFSYRCMADGECLHYSVPVQEYCNTAYKEHGLSYDLKDPVACERVALSCAEIDKRCNSISDATVSGKTSKEACIILERMCLQCQGDCELKKNVNTIEQVIYGISGGIAILILMINAISLLASEDSLSRSNAKRSIVYVILSLLIIIAAVKLIEYLWLSFI